MPRKQYILRIVPNNVKIAQWYKEHGHFNEGDSGLDLFCEKDTLIEAGETVKIPFGISCEMLCLDDDETYNVSYYIFPRSSIYKTPLRLCNSLGLIDAYYRNNIMAYVDNVKIHDFTLAEGQRLFQIATPDLTPITRVEVVHEFLDSSKDRKGGLGSTGQ